MSPVLQMLGGEREVRPPPPSYASKAVCVCVDLAFGGERDSAEERNCFSGGGGNNCEVFSPSVRESPSLSYGGDEEDEEGERVLSSSSSSLSSRRAPYSTPLIRKPESGWKKRRRRSGEPGEGREREREREREKGHTHTCITRVAVACGQKE